MTFAVDGMGAFLSTTGGVACVSLLNDNSVVTIEGRQIQNGSGDGCITLDGATLYITLHETLMSGADGVTGTGTLYITCPTMDCADSCYEFIGTLNALHTGYLHSTDAATIIGSFTGELSCPDIAPSGGDPAVIWTSDLSGEIRHATLGGGGTGVPSVSLGDIGLALANCKIAADSSATYAVENGGDPQTLVVVGSLSCNKPIAAGVTIAQATTFVIPTLPTSEPATVGALWNDGGTVKVSNGP